MALNCIGKIIKANKTCLIAPITNSFATSNFLRTSSDQITHTGQQWPDNDYRLVRFVDKTKKVNANWGIKLVDEIPPKPEKARVVSCDGGGGPLGHPKVYINLDKPGSHACMYCGLRFEKKGHH